MKLANIYIRLLNLKSDLIEANKEIQQRIIVVTELSELVAKAMEQPQTPDRQCRQLVNTVNGFQGESISAK